MVDILLALISFVLGVFVGIAIPKTDYNDLIWKILEARIQIEQLVEDIKKAKADGKITEEEFNKIIADLEAILNKMKDGSA